MQLVLSHLLLWWLFGDLLASSRSLSIFKTLFNFLFCLILIFFFFFLVVKQAIDRLPLFPGVFELVGIGYTGVSFFLPV